MGLKCGEWPMRHFNKYVFMLGEYMNSTSVLTFYKAASDVSLSVNVEEVLNVSRAL